MSWKMKKILYFKIFYTTSKIKGKTLNTYELVREAFRYYNDKNARNVINNGQIIQKKF